MRKYLSFLDIVVCVFLSSFFIWHIYNGDLGLKASKKYKKQIIKLEKKLHETQRLQQRLQNNINAMGDNINIDYLETQALYSWYKVPKNSKIIKLS